MSFHSLKITHHFFGKNCSGDSTQQMVVSLTLVIIVMMAMMMTIIAPAAADDYSCRWGYEEEEMCLCVCPCKHLSFLATPRGRVPVVGHPCCRAHSPAADPLISGNKRGRACNSSKIARGVGGLEGCRESDAMLHSARICYGQSRQKKQYTSLISPLSYKE